MCYIELKNDKYETSEDLKHLLQYILRLDKTAEDSQRANTITNTLAGCQPAMIPNEYLCDPNAVYHLMLFAVRRRQKGTTQFAKHRIVSFAATDCILPQDVVSLAERIASIYAKNGFITAYGIHADRFNSGSIGIITIRGSHGAIGGMESGFAVYAKSEEEFQDEIIKTLAGKAGTALIYGIMDIRAVADIKKADQLLDIWLCHFAGGGFSGVEPSENRLSEPRLSYNEAIKSAKLEELYRRAYKILYDNRDFLLAVQKELLEHETLLNSDLAKIRESCT